MFLDISVLNVDELFLAGMCRKEDIKVVFSKDGLLRKVFMRGKVL